MTLEWFYRLSNWNPQFFREVKGRLKQRNLMIAVVTSIALQMLLLLCFTSLLPSEYSTRNTYCTGKVGMDHYSNTPECIKDFAKQVLVNWQQWWFDVFQAISWALPFILLLAGVYLLIGDMGKEERRGTLNFIRLSPQTSQSILLGKLLGVPIVPYVVVAAAIPLHLWAAIAGQVNPLVVFSIYLFTGAVCACFYTGSLLYASLGGFQGWVGAIAVIICFNGFFQLWQAGHYYNGDDYLFFSEWFWLPIGDRLRWLLPFALLTVGTVTYWFWQAVNRRFRNPNTTVLSKRQSYWMTACFELWMVGFALRQPSPYDRPYEELIIISCFNLIWFLVLIAALTPQRQSLFDWARYRRERVSSGKQFWKRSLLKDLLWGEKSPAPLAIALNLLITIAIFTPWILGWDVRAYDTSSMLIRQFQGFAGMVLSALFVLACAVIAQMLMFMKSDKRAVWATGVIGAAIILPPIVLAVLSIQPNSAPFPWFFTAFSFIAVNEASTLTILFGVLAQVLVLSGLTNSLSRQLQKAGESESKALLQGASAV